MDKAQHIAFRPDPTEDQLQLYSADVLRAFARPGVVYWHTPNEGKRKPQYAKKLKERGLRAGVADWSFLTPYPCFVELKTRTGRLSKDQKAFKRDVEAIGIAYFVARTPDEIDEAFRKLGIIDKSVSP